MEEAYSVSGPSVSTILGEITADPEPTLLEEESTVYDPPAANAEEPSLPEPTLLEAEPTAVSAPEPSLVEPPPLVENARQVPVT